MGGYYNWPTTFQFDPERDLNEYYTSWMLMGTFTPTPVKPLQLWADCKWLEVDYAALYERMSVPASMGWTHLANDGCWYISVIDIPQEEWQQREPIFRQKMTPWIEDCGREWRGKMIPEIEAYWERLKKVDVEKLSNFELLDHFDDWVRSHHKMWEVHMESMVPIYYIYGLFEDMCRELLGIDGSHPQFKTLMSGFDNKMQEIERRTWQLADKAKELGLEPTFQAISNDEELLSELEKSESGQKWLRELREFVNLYGWRTEHCMRIDVPSWMEMPSKALPDIRRAMAEESVFGLDRQREGLVKEREEAERDILSRVPAEKRAVFEKLMRSAQWCTIYSEEHVFYTEFPFPAVGHRVLKEIAKRFVRAKVIDEPDDINFLLPDEIRRPLIVMQRCPMQKIVQIRKQEWQEFLKKEPIPFIGDPSVFGKHAAINPVLRIIAPHPLVKPELKADLYGTGSAPGVVEGIAKVIMDESQFSEFQPGEVLVAPFTYSSWTSLFWMAAGVVTNFGGALAHAVIVGREYGIPCVAGTLEALAKIKTGDRLRVDGDNCCVYILK